MTDPAGLSFAPFVSMAATELSNLLGVATVLGLKHGFDADHLAAIDGLSRLNISAGRPRLARASGLLFSVGHGAVVALVALLLHGRVQQLPAELDGVGAWISIAFLTVLGAANLRQVVAGVGAAPQGLLAPWLLRLPPVRTPAGGLAMGALFALSLDTAAIAVWFGLAGGPHASPVTLAALCATFIAGMVLMDALNGWLVARMISRTDRCTLAAQRMFAGLLATLSLSIAALGVLRLLSPDADQWLARHATDVSLLLVGAVVAGYACLGWRRTALRASGRDAGA